MKNLLKTLLFLLMLALTACGSTTTSSNASSSGATDDDGDSTTKSQLGGTNTGSTIETIGEAAAGSRKVSTNVGLKIKAAASALVPSVTSGTNTSLSAPLSSVSKYSIDGDADWDQFTSAANKQKLIDIFGPGEGAGAPQTSIRSTISLYRSMVAMTLETDPEITCDGSGSKSLTEGDTITVPFFGSIANGTSANRAFDCYTEQIDSADVRYFTLYGVDAEGIVRIVKMSDILEANTNGEGTFSRSYSILTASFAEVVEGSNTRFSLDIQYSLAVIYNGDDATFQTADDASFKIRTRITGEAVLDSNNSPLLGVGDFQVTKYESGVYDVGGSYANATKAIGLGDYGAGEASLLAIDSNVSSLAGAGGTFCVAKADANDAVPDKIAADECSSLNSAFAWTGDLLFTLAPVLNATFTDKSFFNGDNTDLISNSGSNFTIPSYSFSEDEEEDDD
ncbi:MAG: hypothetical protein Q7S68_00875 [Deltaproteobacteria bacterium]|nr:hypothetical protein [Deltaproteobacteria bacterium]